PRARRAPAPHLPRRRHRRPADWAPSATAVARAQRPRRLRRRRRSANAARPRSRARPARCPDRQGRQAASARWRPVLSHHWPLPPPPPLPMDAPLVSPPPLCDALSFFLLLSLLPARYFSTARMLGSASPGPGVTPTARSRLLTTS